MATIRPFKNPADVAAFKRLNLRTFRDSIPANEEVDESAFNVHYQWLLKQFAPFNADKNVIWVADVEGQYVGHLWLGTQVDFFTKRADPWIFDLTVDKKFQRIGIAKQLHDTALDYLKQHGFKRIALQVMAHNQGAAKLYEGLGYKARASSLMREI